MYADIAAILLSELLVELGVLVLEMNGLNLKCSICWLGLLGKEHGGCSGHGVFGEVVEYSFGGDSVCE